MLFKITFHLDGSGVHFNPAEPIHLDALLAWCLAPRQGIRDLQRDQVPPLVRLPLLRNHIGDRWVWAASALMPEGPHGESLQFWRKRFRQARAELTAGSPNLTNGPYRDWQMPLPLLLTTRMVAYASGSRKECRKVLKELKYLGKKRAHGHGKILGMEFDQVGQDYTMIMNGIATRWLPASDGARMVRCLPPYWHPHDRVQCCEVGASREI